MLSVSGKEQGIRVDLPTFSVELPHARELVEFAVAATSPASDRGALAGARDRLTAAMGEAAMVDTAAVVAVSEGVLMALNGRYVVAVPLVVLVLVALTRPQVGADAFLRH